MRSLNAVRPGALALVVALGLAASARRASAQTAPAPDAPPANGATVDAAAAQARELVRRGLAASAAERWADALAAFEQAYALWPQPQVLFNLAAAQAQAGRVTAAVASYERFLRETTTGPVAAYRPLALEALAQVARRVAHARVLVRGAREGDAVVLDGRALPRERWGEPLAVDPGAHTAALARGAFETARATVVLREGETRELLLAAPPAVATTTSAATTARAVASTLPSAGAERAPRRARPAQSVARSPWFWGGLALATGAAVAATIVIASAVPPYGNVPPGRVFVE